MILPLYIKKGIDHERYMQPFDKNEQRVTFNGRREKKILRKEIMLTNRMSNMAWVWEIVWETEWNGSSR